MWSIDMYNDNAIHITPLNDLVEHEVDEDCVCGPTWELVESDDGIMFEMYTHHSLDGRERRE